MFYVFANFAKSLIQRCIDQTIFVKLTIRVGYMSNK